MKKKKVIIFILIFLIIVLSISCLSIRFREGKKNNLIGISDYKIYKNKEIVEIVDDLYIVKNSKGKLEASDFSGEVFAELGSDLLSSKRVNDGYLIICTDGTYLLTEEKNVRRKFNHNVWQVVDIISKQVYYYEIDGIRCIIYDSNFNIIFDYSGEMDFSIIAILDGKVYGSNKKIYNIQTKEEIGSYDNVIKLGDSYYLVLGTDNRFIDGVSRISYQVQSYYKKNDRYVINVNGNSFIIDETGEKQDSLNKKELNDGYYMDASSCDTGWQLKNSDGTIKYNDCDTSYNIEHIEDDIIIIQKNNGKYVYAIKNVLSREYINVTMEGDYLYAMDGEIGYVFDKKGFNIYEYVRDFQYIGNGQYVVSRDNEAIVVDKELNDITYYDEMTCNLELCTFKKDNKYGLYYNGQEQTSNVFLNVSLKEDMCIIKDIAFDTVLTFGELGDKDIKELIKLIDSYYEEIETNDILEKYHLEGKQEMIFKDEVLFKKYAYVIEHNDKLNGYKDILFSFYKAIIGEKDYIDENKLLYALKQLKIGEKDTLAIDGAAGVYNDARKEIEFLKGNFTPSVYYHELYHFLDYNSTYSKNSYDYMCNGKLYSLQEYRGYSDKKNCRVMILPFTQFITEAGAEIYSASYFINNEVVRAYQWGTYIYEMLNYLLGNKVMKDIYYSLDTTYDFYKLMVKGYGMPYEDYNEMVTIFNQLTKIETMYEQSVMDNAKNWLIYLYKLKNPNSAWEQDIEFSYYIKYGQGEDKYNLSSELHNINANIMMNVYGSRRGYNIKDIHVRDKGTYIYFEVLDNKYSIIDNIIVLYDFKNNKMIEYKRIEGV